MIYYAEVGFEPARPLDFEQAVDPLLDALPYVDGIQPTLAGPGDTPAWTALFCVEADTLKAATSTALATFARAVHDGLPGTKVRSRWVHVLDEAEFDRRLDEPVIPALVGISEIATTLGVSKTRARELVAAGTIRAVASLAAGPVCRADDLERYAATPRKPGRPRKVAS